MTAAPDNPGLVRIRAALQALEASLPRALAAVESVNTTTTDIAAGAAALSLIALVFPPAAIGADVLKIVEAVVLLNAVGDMRAGQPGDPAMDHAAGH